MSDIRTLEAVLRKGKVHLITLTSDCDKIEIGTCVVVASPHHIPQE